MGKTNRPKIRVVDCANNSVNDRPMTDSEYEQYIADTTEYDAFVASMQKQELDRSELLNRLGLTPEEAALLLS